MQEAVQDEPTMQLNGKQRRYLRALGHNLDAIVRVGKGGITDGLVGALDQALEDHELIKVRVLEESPLDRHEAAQVMAERCGAAVAQVLGRSVLMYRPRSEDPKIVLPKKGGGSDEDTIVNG